MSAFFLLLGKKINMKEESRSNRIWTGYAFRSCKVRDPYFKGTFLVEGIGRYFFRSVYSEFGL